MKIFSCLLVAVLGLAASSWAGSGNPKVGEMAPAVDARDQDGHAWRLADFAGRKAVLLYFYPKDGTPGCTKEACGYRDQMGELKSKGVEVVGVSMDNAESHKRFITAQRLNFNLLVDTDGKITDSYGARMPAKNMARRISFLIGKDGRIAHVTDNPSAEKHLEETAVAIAALK
jgi:peroxiredoxin Q/BCP